MSSWITFDPRINLRHRSPVRFVDRSFVVAAPDNFQAQLARVIAFGFILSMVLFG